MIIHTEYFIELLKYDKWANQKIVEALSKIDEIPPKCKILFHHIAAATEVWLSRVTNVERHYKSLFEESDLNINRELLNQLEDRWIEFLKKDHVKVEELIKYKNTKGQEFTNKLQDILTHLMTHNHYHRGQINQLLRQNNFEPAVTDYIFYKRM